MQVTIKDKNGFNKRVEVDASGIVVFWLAILMSPIFIIAYGFAWATFTLLAVALTGFLHFMVTYVVDHWNDDKNDSQDLHGS